MTVPVYIQIHNDMKTKITTGAWQVGSRIPSERKLAEDYGVSRMTLRQAVQNLIDDGLLRRAVGSGTYVTSQKIREHMANISSFTETMLAQGKQPASQTLSYKFSEPSFREAELLALPAHERVLRMERLRFGDQVPICLETTVVNATFLNGLDQSEITESLYRSLEQKKGLVPARVKQSISAGLASKEVASLLKIKLHDPILKLRQQSYLKNHQPFEIVESEYAAARYEFYLNQA